MTEPHQRSPLYNVIKPLASGKVTRATISRVTPRALVSTELMLPILPSEIRLAGLIILLPVAACKTEGEDNSIHEETPFYFSSRRPQDATPVFGFHLLCVDALVRRMFIAGARKTVGDIRRYNRAAGRPALSRYRQWQDSVPNR